MKLKFLTTLTLLTFFCQTGKAQQSDIWSKIRLEAGWGYNLPTAPTSGITASDFAGVKSFYGGVKYELDDVWGIRGTYAFNSFEHKNDKDFGLDVHKLMAEATYNILQASGTDFAHTFDVEAHAGLGLSLADSKVSSGSDKMVSFQVGVMPQYKITDNVSVLLDASYVINLGQNYNYAGVHAKENGKGTTGGYFTANIGIAVKF